jgi:hypothetical protein
VSVSANNRQADPLAHLPESHDGNDIVTACSDLFNYKKLREAPKFVLRKFHCKGPCSGLEVWEETGESIARHIWYGIYPVYLSVF